MRTTLIAVAVAATVVALSVGVVWATSHDSTEVRIAAKRLETGRIEFGLQQRELDGSWGDRILPARRFFPASGLEGRWLTSSPIDLAIPTPTPGPMLTVAEYAEWCAAGSGVDEVAEDATWGDYSLMLDSVIDDGLGISPPDALRDFHDARIQGLILLRLTVDDFDHDAAFRSADVLGPVLLYVWWVAQAQDALAEDVRTTLEEAGCIRTETETESGESGGGGGAGDDPLAATPPSPSPTVQPTSVPDPLVADGPPSWRTLQHVIDRDELWCGVKQTQPLFGFKEADGTVTGFDVEFCKAIAAAVLGDATKVEYVDASDASTRFKRLNDAKFDVLIRTTTITASRDRELSVDYAQATFYTGQGFMVRKDSSYESTSDLGDATICVQTGRRTEQNVADHFTNLGLVYTPLGGLSSDVADAFFSGRCDVLTLDVSDLASRLALREDASDYSVLPQIISKEPFAPAVRDYDSEWKDVVNWVVHGLIAAEELGITQANVHALAANPPNTTIARLLGGSYEGGEVATLGFDAIDAQFIQRAIAAVGNYGEIYERTIGDHIPRACTLNALALDTSVDCPPGQGGILYALPYR